MAIMYCLGQCKMENEKWKRGRRVEGMAILPANPMAPRQNLYTFILHFSFYIIHFTFYIIITILLILPHANGEYLQDPEDR